MSMSSAGSEARRPTMADVARIAGVSLKTVSRVVNNVPTVDPELVRKVNAAVAELGFRRNDMARNLRAGRRSATVGLLIEDLANPFYAGIAAAVAHYALECDTLLITASSEEDADRERRLLLELCERRVDGLLVVPAADADHVYLRSEIERGTPIVFLDRPPRNLRADTVLIDNAAGARQAVEQLVAAGHTRIAVIAGRLSISTMTERLAAAEKALEQAGLPYRPDLVKYGLQSVPDATAAITAMLDGPEPPTAIFALNNRLILGALSALDGRTTPVDLICFDDFETAPFVPWPLTVVSYDVREIGRIGAELLFDRIGGDRSRPKTVVVPTELMMRSGGLGRHG